MSLSSLELQSRRLDIGVRKDIWACSIILFALLLENYSHDLQNEDWAQFKFSSSINSSLRPPVPSSVSSHAIELLEILSSVRNRNVPMIKVKSYDVISSNLFFL